jgi:hypothetical protein
VATWELDPEPADEAERAALLAAAEQALGPARTSAWWRSGLADLDGGPPPEQAGRDPGEVEP